MFLIKYNKLKQDVEYNGTLKKTYSGSQRGKIQMGSGCRYFAMF